MLEKILSRLLSLLGVFSLMGFGIFVGFAFGFVSGIEEGRTKGIQEACNRFGEVWLEPEFGAGGILNVAVHCGKTAGAVESELY